MSTAANSAFRSPTIHVAVAAVVVVVVIAVVVVVAMVADAVGTERILTIS
jgi:hypothetical protein